MRLLLIIFTLLISLSLCGQGLFDSYSTTTDNKPYELNGFLRSSHYLGKGGTGLIHFPSSLSDASLQIKAGNGFQYSLFGDLRFRYGTEFNNEVLEFDLREAWVGIYSSKFTFEVGKKIVKWGRTDIINPIGQIAPRNMTVRSPDFEDRDLASSVISGKYTPGDRISLTLIVFPRYNSSVLPFSVMDLPDYVSVNKNGVDNRLNSGIGYGFRSDYQLKKLDASIYLFDGYNGLPEIVFGGIQLPDGISTENPIILLEESPYKLRMAGFDFEAVAGNLGWRGSFTWSKPYGESSKERPLPFPEINMVAAIEFSPGDFIITAEYGLKLLTDYSESVIDPAFPVADDLGQLLLLPLEVAEEMVGLQINSFNRLFNNQVEKAYSMAGINLTTTGNKGRWQPDITCLYNITTGDLLLMPVVVFKPYERVSIKLGLEYWYGDDGSLFSYMSDPLNSIWTGIKVNF